jgi:hypothetical protein
MTYGAWQSDDWRPIGTAPRDGREIVGKDEFGREKRCRWVGPADIDMPIQIGADEAGPLFTPEHEGEWITSDVPAEAFEPALWTPVRIEPGV